MKANNEKYLIAQEKMNDFLDFMASEHGITSNQFLSEVDILNKYSLEELSHALTHYCFRNGPVENMHADGKLSQEDMKTLNKFCNDKIFTFLTMIKDNKLAELNKIIEFGLRCGSNWDKPEYTGAKKTSLDFKSKPDSDSKINK